MTFISGLIVGLMVGAFLGLVKMCVLTVASDGREE